MASEQDEAVFPDESQDLDDDDEPSTDENDLDENDDVLNDEEDEELEEEDINSLSPSTSSLPQLTAAVTATASDNTAIPLAIPAPSALTVVAVPADESGPDPKRQRVELALVERKPQQLDESRRLFQRLWTDEDEIELLQGFLDYTTQRGNSNSHHHDTSLFYDQIKSKLQLDFNKNQLVEKLRRLKKKYRNVMNKISSGKDFSFKSPHDQATFEISRKIWSNSVGKGGVGGVEDNVLDDEEAHANNANLNDDFGDKKTPKSRKRTRSRPPVKVEEKRLFNDGFVVNNSNNNGNVENVGAGGGLSGGGNTAGLIEETVRSCLSPLFKELLSGAMGGGCGARGFGSLAMNAMPMSFGGLLNFGGGGSSSELVDERWRKQQILELEVYSKRLELVQDQIKATLEELRSMGG